MPGAILKFAATTTGALPGIPAPGRPWHKYALEVKGSPVTATSWSVTLEGSLDGVNWTTLATHTTPDGGSVFTTNKPCTWCRANVGALTLGSATSIAVFVTAEND